MGTNLGGGRVSGHRKQPAFVATCCLAVILALVLGVGLPDYLLLRHIVQTLPLWIAVVLGFRRKASVGLAAIPMLLIWFTLMTLIWSYLLGFSHLVSGHFTPLDIAMTVIVGIASVVGIVVSLPLRPSISMLGRVGAFVLLGLVQVACFYLSFFPPIAHR